MRDIQPVLLSGVSKGAYPFGDIAGIHDALAYINEIMDLEGLELHQDGESYPNDYFESPHYDFISRCDGDEWPE